MPRVKYSTLISALAGKSNGSVFSKNQGGSYFRTNKAGYGLKTNSQSQNQGKFKTIGRKWSQLSDVEREAWNSAVVNYPTKNIFGDERLPTGYELFCRVNGGLVARNMPEKIMPEMPAVLPTINSLSWDTPDEFMYQNVNSIKALTNQSVPSSSRILFEEDSALVSSDSIKQISWNIDFGSDEWFNSSVLRNQFNMMLNFLIDKDDDTKGLFLSLYCNSDTEATMTFQWRTVTGIWTANYKMPIITLLDKALFTILINDVSTFDFGVWTGGADLTPSDVSTTGTGTQFNLNFVEVQCAHMPTGYSPQITSIQVYDYLLDPSIWDMLWLGYVYLDVALIIQIPENKNLPFEMFGNVGVWYDGVVTSGGNVIDTGLVLAPTRIMNVPRIVLDVDGTVTGSFDVDIQSTKPVSSGVGLKSADQIKVESFSYSGTDSVDITGAMQNKWGWFTGGQDFNIAIRLFDTNAGVVYLPMASNKPSRKPRFKAGRELTGTVASNKA